MTATEELRRMLNERGVHWWSGEDEQETLWESNGLTWEYSNNENGDAWLGFLGACEQDITPEQAIAATLGRERTCHWDYPQGINGWVGEFACSNCGHQFNGVGDGVWEYCPNCGAKVVD